MEGYSQFGHLQSLFLLLISQCTSSARFVMDTYVISLIEGFTLSNEA